MIDFFHRTGPVKPASRSIVSLEELLSLYDKQLVLRFSNVSASGKAALSGAVARLSLDIWALGDDFVDIRLHSDFINPLLHHIPKALAASHSVLISDLAAAVYHSYPNFGPDDSRIKAIKIQRAVPQLAEIWRFNDNFFFQDFQPLEVIIRWMQLLEAMFPSHVEYISIGKSFEGREIPALRVRTPDPPTNRPRKAIMVTGGFHGREWISTSTVNYVAWSYISSFGVDRIITKFLTHFDIVFVPVVNPDSFEYTWSVDRLWRKSRQSIEGSICRGIDLDHAFSFGWNSSQTQGEEMLDAMKYYGDYLLGNNGIEKTSAGGHGQPEQY
ncbi:putative metallocarboxypeptidase [Escovopsis weberi]|uniref:Inactive metallocarboxypeptidase ECM14 n=1 Tax=Escovopsis weberi TaxID=150374 RepID=A0A0M9VS98_ESCWE|nr:putative metallocarboxypeptidase [Escovopsis weberi]